MKHHKDVPNAGISHSEIAAYHWVRRMNQFIARKHPALTKQIFDFRQNLFAYV